MQVNANQQYSQPAAATTVSKSNNRGKRKSRWKLKFHHQALPPEYLDHYEASLQQRSNKNKSPPPVPSPPAIISTTFTPIPAPNPAAITPTCSATPVLSPSSSQSTSVRYEDLPYMGEMTLDNARPRRGRKPKKADICHLIYKNYGTTVVDEPLNLCVRDLRNGEGSQDVSTRQFKFTGGGATSNLEETKSVSLGSTGDLRPPDKNRARGREPKRKSRKSLAREKLERTFKERGFLIQTQQLESAQGATYCKFRQLRKFTRYLFRSWKHHLPGDVVNNNNNNNNNIV